MPKPRRRGVNDMIFELENGEIESSSSDDEAPNNVDNAIGDLNQDLGVVEDEPFATPAYNDEPEMRENSPCTVTSIECDSNSQSTNHAAKLDNNDKIPLISVRFRDRSTAKRYKSHLKKFIMQLVCSSENSNNFDTDSDEDLVIWPNDVPIKQDANESLDSNLFILDTTPSKASIFEGMDVPAYSKKYNVLDNKDPAIKKPEKRFSRPQECFNCDGKHTLRDCPHARDFNRINQKRKAMMSKPGRYHMEELNKSGSKETEFVAGRISGALRRALGLQRHQLPQHVYRMRLLGYPPGWLLNAKITHSGIAMFDSSGKEVVDPEDEDGEIAMEGSKDKYDVKKILDFPGFNIPASSKYTDEYELFGCPAMSENDSKVAMLERLAPRKAEAYRRKKLIATQPSGQEKHPEDINIQADMDIDDEGNHDHPHRVPTYIHPLSASMLLLPPPPPPPEEQPSLPPPLPPDAPPPPDVPPPPPPDVPPPPPPPDVPPPPSDVPTPPADGLPPTNPDFVLTPEDTLPLPDLQDEELTLDDLETRKMQLLAALGENTSICTGESPRSEYSGKPADISGSPSPTFPDEESSQEQVSTPVEEMSSGNERIASPSLCANVTSSPLTPRLGEVRQSTLGTPVISSSISKLPEDFKFSKNICDLINFENLPDSTGKYEKMSGIIKKVRTAVFKIQEEN